MGKKLIIIFGVIIFVVVMVVYFASRVVSITGPLIWIDRSSMGNWKMSVNSAQWWEELSTLNPNMVDKSRRVVVYLLPTLQVSKVAFGRKNQPPTLYADWRIWGRSTQVLTISINWDEWEAIEPDERQKRLSEFVANQLARYWGASAKDTSEMTRKILAGEVEPPIQLSWKQKGAK